MMTPAQVERFWESATADGDCLLWRKSLRRNGYGQIKISGRNWTTHRVAYELTYGPIPDGDEVDHICRRRNCIRPAHLRLATHKQNAENRGPRRHSTSGVRGVTWDKSRGCWSAAITHNYRTINVGRFPSIAAAQAAVIEARRAHFTHSIEVAR